MSDVIAIIGASGILGRALVIEGSKLGLPCIRGSSRLEDLKNYALVDITNQKSLEFFFDSWNPKIVINCAAYTKVDDAEDDYGNCFKINSVGVENLANICKQKNVYLIHISSDYVFGGDGVKSEGSYDENEKCAPCGIYGWSKYFSERSVQNILPNNSLIIRTSWLHGIDGPSFLRSISKVAQSSGKLKVVNDQYGSMTWAPWLAEVIIKLSSKKITGIIHACAEDVISWHQIAELYLSKSGISCELSSQTTEESGRKAPRPKYSKLSTKSLENILEEKIPSNADFIDSFLRDAVL